MPQQTIKLLVVDDAAADRKRIVRAVQRSGLPCDCREAAAVAKALDAYDQHRSDCVILDYSRPGEQSLQAITALLQRAPFLPVITATAKGQERLAAEALKMGAMDYVTKSDITPGVIRQAIEGAMRRATLKRMQADQQEALVQFTRVLVHDLKTPTQSMLGFAKLAEAFLGEEHFDRAKALAQCRRIGESVIRMNGLLDSLHAYTEADAHLQIGTVAMDEVVKGVLGDLDVTILARGAKIMLGDLPVLRGDHAQLAQLLQNLICNAIKFCNGDTPEIHIEAARQPAGGGWCFEVRDNGIGIPETELVSIFEPFRRLHSASKYEGTGLGLATCKKIVERHGGTIWCVSRDGQGTSMFFTVPEQQSADGDLGLVLAVPKPARRRASQAKPAIRAG